MLFERLTGSGVMKLEEVRSLALQRGITPGKFRKWELIRAIQKHEGNFDCYATAYDGICDQSGCLWRKDCFQEAKRQLQV
jgi:hypothetical protein